MRLARHTIEVGQFRRKFAIDFHAVVEVITKGCVDFGWVEVRVMADDFLGGSAVAEVVRGDLRDSDPWKKIQAGGFTGGFVNAGNRERA